MRAIKLAGLFLGFLLAASPALAAWSETEKTTAQNSANHSLTSSSISVTGGHLLVVMGEVRLAASTDPINVSDSVSDSFTVYPCEQGALNVDYSFIAFAITSGLSSGTVTVADGSAATAVALTFQVWDMSGNASSSVEDSGVRNCAVNGTATTSPTVTSVGTAANAGELFVSVWGVPSTSTSASFTAGGSWLPTNGYGTGNTNILAISDYIVNAGTSAQTNSPTTNSKTYTMPITAFIPSGITPPPQKQIMQSVP